MRKYIEHIKNTREPHQRRQHAVQVAGVLTGGLLVVWLGTLGYRLSSQEAVAQSPDTSLTAAAVAAYPGNAPHLEVSTTSIYSN